MRLPRPFLVLVTRLSKTVIQSRHNGASLTLAHRVLQGLLALIFCGLPVPGGAGAAVPVYAVRIVKVYPHDVTAFTEGLFYDHGYLYESTGLAGQSGIRKTRLETGEIVQQRTLDPAYFGEGIVAWKDRLIQLTWRNGIGFIYDLASFRPLGTFRYAGEGWALTHDANRIIMSDGTSTLRFLNPDTLAETGTLKVAADGCPLLNINELEWVNGDIYANVWLSDLIARIDVHTGRVLAFLDASAIGPPRPPGSDAVLNGIAFDAAGHRLFITGKLWPHIYEIQVGPIEPMVTVKTCTARPPR